MERTMAVTAVSDTSGTTVRAQSQSLAANFDSFLRLLTTQLQNQDPLAPMDANEFTSQLVEFASVEQAIQTNKRLDELGEAVGDSATTSAMGMLGREVTAATDRIGLGTEGDATIGFTLPETVAKATVTILDGQGRALRALAGGVAAGEQTLRWDGLDGSGNRMAAGSYRVRVDAARADGTAVAAEQHLTGTVEAIEPGSEGIVLVVGGAEIALSEVRGVRAPQSSGDA
jgi:flagellar basal-body rod modification protein FlgD